MNLQTMIRVTVLGLAMGLSATALAAENPAAAKPGTTNVAGQPVNLGMVLDPTDAYKPVPMDKFLFRIIEDPAKGAEESLTVNALNEITFRVTRGSSEGITISTKGKPIAEIKKELKKFLDENYYQNATIYFRLQDQAVRPGQAIIMGSIKATVPLFPGSPKSVYQAILEVGINDMMNLKSVKLWRYNKETKKDEPTEINMQNMLKGGSRESDVILQDGDRIEVKDKTIFFGF